MTRAQVVVLASGGGTNCQALLDACGAGELNADIAAVITNNSSAGVLERARKAGVPSAVVDHTGSDAPSRAEADRRLIDAIATFQPDLVVLAGWMRILGDEVGATIPIVNLHPALPDTFPGVRAIERAFAAWQRHEITESGVMIHWVPDSGVDIGPLITSRVVVFEPDDTLERFETRMHDAEHTAIVEGVRIALKTIAGGT